MKTIGALLLLVVGAEGFVRHRGIAQTRRASSSLKMTVEEELGVTPPLGVYDPLGWLETQPENFARRRAVERKHGRVAMVAVVGMLIHNAGIEFPGYLSIPNSPLGTPEGIKFSDIPDGFAGLAAVPFFGQIQARFAVSGWSDVHTHHLSRSPDSCFRGYYRDRRVAGKQLLG